MTSFALERSGSHGQPKEMDPFLQYVSEQSSQSRRLRMMLPTFQVVPEMTVNGTLISTDSLAQECILVLLIIPRSLHLALAHIFESFS